MTAELDAVRAELAAAAAALAPADAAVERIVHEASNTPFTTPLPTAAATEHRREHRMGRVPKIDADPELRAFVAARVDRHTFQEVADAFPPERRVGCSAIHPWWRRDRARRRAPDPGGRDGIRAGLPT